MLLEQCLIHEKCLTEGDNEFTAASYLGHMLGSEAHVEMWSGLGDVVAHTELSRLIFAPVVHLAFTGQRSSETLANHNLGSLTLNLLHTVGRQKFTECTCAPKKKTSRVFADRSTKATSGNKAHWDV